MRGIFEHKIILGFVDKQSVLESTGDKVVGQSIRGFVHYQKRRQKGSTVL